MSKLDFVKALRRVRNLMAHDARPRAAVWLSPAVVAAFRPADFADLPPDQHAALIEAVRRFGDAAVQVPPGEPPSDPQVAAGKAAFESMAAVLRYDLPPADAETAAVGAVLAAVAYPPWVLNWDYKLDHYDFPVVEVMLYIDGHAVAVSQYSQATYEVIQLCNTALWAAHIDRWPHVRLRTPTELLAA